MSSHREAPETAKDPVADSTDVYAFVSPDRPDTVTLIANYIPFQAPDGGPNFYEFGDDVAYDIHISNKGKGEADITYRFHFHTMVRNPKTFLYNTGPITSLKSPTLEPAAVLLGDPDQGRQGQGARREAGVPAGQHRPALARRTTPTWPPRPCTRSAGAGSSPASAPTRSTSTSGSIFDLGALRPFQHLHLIPMRRRRGRELAAGRSTCTRSRSRCRSPRSRRSGELPDQRRASPGAVIGVWASASRRKSRMFDQHDGRVRRPRSLGAGLAAGQPAVQRGHRPDGAEGRLERPTAEGRQRLREVRQPPGAGQAAAGALPGRLPAPRGVPQGAGGPERDPADRHPVGSRARASRTSPGRSRRTCCGSTSRSRRPPAPTAWAWSAATRPASRTDAASTTTS